MYHQHDWSPATWSIMLAFMVFFVVALMGMVIYLVARAGQAVSTPEAAPTGLATSTPATAELPQIRVPVPSPAPDDASLHSPTRV